MSDGEQVASAYFSDNAPSHQVEFALNDALLIEASYEKSPLVRWLQYQKRLYGGREPKVHKRGEPVEWFRMGFASVDDALKFLECFKNERRMLDPHVRWQVPGSFLPELPAEASPAIGRKSKDPEPSAESKDQANTWNQAVDRMVSTAQQTTALSNGQSALKTIKNKDNAFISKEEFMRHVRALIEQQNGRCAISGLPLQPDEQCDDLEMLASLDRIDSNRHYEPGNLQVVCRFINRWKGSDENVLFLRLIEVLRLS